MPSWCTHTSRRAQSRVPPRAPRILSVALALDQVLEDVAFTRREKNVQGPTPAAKQAAKKAAAEQAKATQRTKEHEAEMVTDKSALTFIDDFLFSAKIIPPILKGFLS